MAETHYGVQFLSDKSIYDYSTLDKAQQVQRMDPINRKVVKLTVEDYVPPKKYKWTVKLERQKLFTDAAQCWTYEGTSLDRATAEKMLAYYGAHSSDVRVVSKIEEIDG